MADTILLIEDEDDTRELLGRALERAGYRCKTAADTGAALALARDEPTIDVVVTDVVLGRDDRAGLQLLGALRELGIGAPVVVMTAFADVAKVKSALNQGAAYFLEKPFPATELIEVLQRLKPRERELEPALRLFFAASQLTEKEQSVARYLLQGLSSREIAALSHNSPKTIRQHVSEIYAKCGVNSRAQFFSLAYAQRGRAR